MPPSQGSGSDHRVGFLCHRRRPSALRGPCASHLKPDRLPPCCKHRLTQWLSCAELTSIRYCVQEVSVPVATFLPLHHPNPLCIAHAYPAPLAPVAHRPATSTCSTRAPLHVSNPSHPPSPGRLLWLLTTNLCPPTGTSRRPTTTSATTGRRTSAPSATSARR
jgi:hypothetical protein